jgi:hypothetical protein
MFNTVNMNKFERELRIADRALEYLQNELGLCEERYRARMREVIERARAELKCGRDEIWYPDDKPLPF